MPLTPEQQNLISRRAQADSPSRPAAYAFWAALGLIGGHRFYLGRRRSAAALAALTCLALALISGAVAYGGTPLDGVFFAPNIDDVLRASQNYRGAAMFYPGLAALSAALIWWLADAFILAGIIGRRREAIATALIRFYRDYQPRRLPEG